MLRPAPWEDGETNRWLEELALTRRYDLQQTDGSLSPHLPSTEENNRRGIIDGENVLQAIATAYSAEPELECPRDARKYT